MYSTYDYKRAYGNRMRQAFWPIQLHRQGIDNLPATKALSLTAPWQQKPSQNMSAAPQMPPTSTTTTSGSVASTSTGSVSGSAGTKGQVNNAYGSTFRIPTGIKLEQFDGSDWVNWSGIMEVILMLHECNDPSRHPYFFLTKLLYHLP